MTRAALTTAALFMGICIASLTHAQNSGSQPTPAPLPTPATAPLPTSPIDAAMASCAQQFRQQHIPRSQTHSFMSACVKQATAAPDASGSAQ